jgi:hypothetical protein
VSFAVHPERACRGSRCIMVKQFRCNAHPDSAQHPERRRQGGHSPRAAVCLPPTIGGGAAPLGLAHPGADAAPEARSRARDREPLGKGIDESARASMSRHAHRCARVAHWHRWVASRRRGRPGGAQAVEAEPSPALARSVSPSLGSAVYADLHHRGNGVHRLARRASTARGRA